MSDPLDGASLGGVIALLIASLLTMLTFGLWFGFGGVTFVAAVIFAILGAAVL